MPELRKDPILGRWVIIASERAKELDNFECPAVAPSPLKECIFCKGNEHKVFPETFSLKDERQDWRVRVVSSQDSFLQLEGEPWKKGKGPYDFINAIGSHEVIIESPDHVENMADLTEKQITDVFSTYRQRIKELEKNQDLRYVLIFKNYKKGAGGGEIKHTHSQLLATPVNLKRVKEELEGAKFYFKCHERCGFCDMIRQEVGTAQRVVLDEGGFLALVPFASRFPFEVWVMPVTHSPDFYAMSDDQTANLAKVMKKVLLKIKVLLGDPPYNYIIHTAPFRRPYPGYWSTIDEDYHWHIEIVPRLTQVAGFEWGTGFYICPSLPEEAAKYLKETKV
ncbi:MAG: galactose-1-phosphate uridylyltransferase [Candidatus Omnitrophota bacterium]|nr:MAG: galactose-1-phosphate uridylyltransferase [Candidatus Omnitrophota bacterium]